MEVKKMRTFEKYVEHVKHTFKPYKRCMVKERVKSVDREIITIVPVERPTNSLSYGELGIIFDQETIGFFGDFLPDDYIDWFDNSWEKYSEKEILEFLDKKIEEYKNYIDNGYFFTFYNEHDIEKNQFAEVYIGDFDELDYEKLYMKRKFTTDVDYIQIKSVTVTNFYGDILVENKILN